MLIELGPRGPVYGRDWRIQQNLARYPRVVAAEFANEDYMTVNGEEMFDAAARWLGFDVDSFGYIKNWDDVPHLWELTDAKP